jgi:mRNA-degrading endonuclease RelE of RelBE toxin-antitoxin system
MKSAKLFVGSWLNTRRPVTSDRDCPVYGNLRWTQRSRNKGKRGGTRIVYFYAVPERIVLLYAYSKDEKEDLTNADRKNLKAAADELKAAIARDKSRSHDQVGRRSGKRS